MNAPEQSRGRHLTGKAQSNHANGNAGGGGLFFRWFSAIAARKCNQLLDTMDAGLVCGVIEGSLPDGTRRILGGRAKGPSAEMNIRSWKALIRIGWAGSVGLYEGWLAGEWESPDPVQIFALFVLNRKSLGNSARASTIVQWVARTLNWFRRNTRAGSRRNIEFHYDLGNDFYAAWLDASMTYSSAMFDEPISETQTLENAQAAKNEALLARLDLQNGDHLLEIGCGWGALAEQALANSDIRYHGVTLSQEQADYATKRLRSAGLSANAEITLTDYRDVAGTYDAIASVEMVEAVGQKYWPAYFKAIADNLKPGGKAALQYIRMEDDMFDAYARGVDFIQRYIFPGGMLISESRFRALAENAGLEWRDQHDFGLHYAETLRRWLIRFETAVDKGRLPAGFDDKFVRVWRFYLMYCEGGFRGGGINVAQVTLRKTAN
jgi:cyclopropane-fatty-acyl-phospholipid synthase